MAAIFNVMVNGDVCAADQCFRPVVTMGQNNNNSTASSSCYRRRLMRRLKEKFQPPSNVLADPLDECGRPTVVKVGTVSSCASSTMRSATSRNTGSWRFVDELFRRNYASSSPTTCPSTVSSVRSGRSNKTIIYDDRWLEVSKPNFCTVVPVDAESEPSNKYEHYTSIITVVNPAETAPVEPRERSEEAGFNAMGTSDMDMDADMDMPDQTNSNSNSKLQPALSDIDSPGGNLQGAGPFVTDAPNLAPLAPLLVPAQPPAGLPLPDWTIAAGSAPIELTGWRFRCPEAEASANASANGEEGAANGQTNAHGFFEGRLSQHHVLTADGLPRMYPHWALNAPLRFEEQYEEEAKGCCGSSRGSQSAFIRWFIATISVIGLSCVIIGIVLGALTVSGSTRLTLCLLMIGVGVVLITVSGIAWRLTSLESNDCCGCLRSFFLSLCCMRTERRHQNALFPERPRSRMAYSRVRTAGPCPPPPHFANMMQPEFAWRPPPPSYQASMQENFLTSIRHSLDGVTFIGSPPPTYRSQGEETSRPSIVDMGQNVSGPPSYRSNDTMQNAANCSFSPSLNSDCAVFVPPCNFRFPVNSSPISPLPSNNDISANQTNADVVVVVPEPVQHDEAASLVLNEQIQASVHVSHPTVRQAPFPNNLPYMDANERQRTPLSRNADRLTVIDCSAPVPVGFEVREARGEQRILGRMVPQPQWSLEQGRARFVPIANVSPMQRYSDGPRFVPGPSGMCFMAPPAQFHPMEPRGQNVDTSMPSACNRAQSYV